MRTRGIALGGFVMLGLVGCTGGPSRPASATGPTGFELVDTDWSEPDGAGGNPCGGSNERTCKAPYTCNAGRCGTRCGSGSFDGASRSVALICSERSEVTGVLDNVDAFKNVWIPLEGGAICGGHLTIETTNLVRLSAHVTCSDGPAVDVDCGAAEGASGHCAWVGPGSVDLRWTCADTARAGVSLLIRSTNDACGASPLDFALHLIH